MDNRTYGYARVSTREQNEDRQLEAQVRFGVSKHNIIVDKASGNDTEREGYQYLKRQILRNIYRAIKPFILSETILLTVTSFQFARSQIIP